MMCIKKGRRESTDDFWGDLFSGGYLKPKRMLINKEDINRVEDAMRVLREFQESCETQIADFYR